MSVETNVITVLAVYEAFGRGDVRAITDRLTDDVHWVAHLDPVVSWSGDYSTKDRVPEFFSAIFQSVDVEAFEPQEWIAQNDTVVSVGVFACRVHATGKHARTRFVFLWKLRDGVIHSYEQFHEPAVADAFR